MRPGVTRVRRKTRGDPAFNSAGSLAPADNEDHDMTTETTILPPGATYEPRFLDPRAAAALAAAVDARPWSAALRRRVQHHGWRYDYRTRRVRPEDRLGPLPLVLGVVAERLFEEGRFEAEPDQAIVNEYLRRVALGLHQQEDRVPEIRLEHRPPALGTAAVDPAEGADQLVADEVAVAPRRAPLRLQQVQREAARLVREIGDHRALARRRVKAVAQLLEEVAVRVGAYTPA